MSKKSFYNRLLCVAGLDVKVGLSTFCHLASGAIGRWRKATLARVNPAGATRARHAVGVLQGGTVDTDLRRSGSVEASSTLVSASFRSYILNHSHDSMSFCVSRHSHPAPHGTGQSVRPWPHCLLPGAYKLRLLFGTGIPEGQVYWFLL